MSVVTRNAAKGRLDNTFFVEEILNEGLAVQRFFDAVLGALSITNAADDVLSLAGKLHTGPKAVSDVEIAGFLVQSDPERRRIVGAGFGRDRQIITTAPTKPRRSVAGDTREPFPFEQATAWRTCCRC